MISERKPRLSAQRRVSIALPRVLSERSKSTQQRTQRSNSGLSREISLELVARLAPLISKRRPRPEASSSIASAMREAPPVRATMPSAFCASATSCDGTRQMNHRNPKPSSTASAAHIASVERPTPRSRERGRRPGGSAGRGVPAAPSSALVPAVAISFHPSCNHSAKFGGAVARHGQRSSLMNRFNGVIDRAARGQGGDPGDQRDLHHHRQIAQSPDREAAEQGGKLIAAGAAAEPCDDELGERKQRDGAAAADQAALQSQVQEMPLEVPGDEIVLGADEMQHLDHRAI